MVNHFPGEWDVQQISPNEHACQCRAQFIVSKSNAFHGDHMTREKKTPPSMGEFLPSHVDRPANQ
jgi:hypothetical protein